MKAFINGKIFDGLNFLEGHTLVIDESRIVELSKDVNLGEEVDVVDLEGKLITAGFIDLQLNGCGGVLFNDDISEATLETIHQTNLKSGCTSFLPTLITTTNDNIRKSLDLVKGIVNSSAHKKIGVLGLHIEGPFISTEKRGVHREDLVREFDQDILDDICTAGSDIVKIITIAPENVKTKEILQLNNAGINVSMGHTNATYDETMDKIGLGIPLATHLFNAMTSFLHRDPGVVGAIFNSQVKAGIIADGFHVDYGAIKAAKKIMGDRLFLVTDAVAPTGTDMKEFIFEGRRVFHENGKCFDENGALGGAAITMIESIKNLVGYADISLAEALRMASLYPAKAIGVDGYYGQIKVGGYADLVITDDNLDIKGVYNMGELV